jgi:hypothetical protein
MLFYVVLLFVDVTNFSFGFFSTNSYRRKLCLNKVLHLSVNEDINDWIRVQGNSKKEDLKIEFSKYLSVNFLNIISKLSANLCFSFKVSVKKLMITKDCQSLQSQRVKTYFLSLLESVWMYQKQKINLDHLC